MTYRYCPGCGRNLRNSPAPLRRDGNVIRCCACLFIMPDDIDVDRSPSSSPRITCPGCGHPAPGHLPTCGAYRKPASKRFVYGDKVQTNARWDDCDLHDHMEGKVVVHLGAHPGYIACLFDSEESPMCMRDDLIEKVAAKPDIIPCHECGGCIWVGGSYCRENHKSTCSHHEDYVAPKPDRRAIKHGHKVGDQIQLGESVAYVTEVIDDFSFKHSTDPPDRRAELREKYTFPANARRGDLDATLQLIRAYEDINELLDMLEKPSEDGQRWKRHWLACCDTIKDLKAELAAKEKELQGAQFTRKRLIKQIGNLLEDK